MGWKRLAAPARWHYGLLCGVWFWWGCRAFFPEAMFLGTPYMRDAVREQVRYTDTLPVVREVIRPGDVLMIQVYPSEGIELIEGGGRVGGVSGRGGGGVSGVHYEVSAAGTVDLPLVGSVYLAGLSLAEARHRLAVLYSRYYRSPFVVIRRVHRNAYVILGVEGAKVVPLARQGVPLIEVVAAAGGLPAWTRARQIRILRRVDSVVYVREIDLRKVERAMYAYIPIYDGDIVHVYPAWSPSRLMSREVYPVLTMLSSFSSLLLTVVLLVTVGVP